MKKTWSMRRPDQNDTLVFALWAFGVFAVPLLLVRGWPTNLADRDFAGVWAAGKLAIAGHGAQAFDVDALRATAKKLAGTAPTIKITYPYPPQALFIAVPLALLPLIVAFWAWQAISLAVFYFAARPYLPPRFPSWLAILTPAALINIIFGQVGLFFGALWLFAFSGSAIASAALGLKPHLGVLVAVDVLRRKRLLRTAIWSAAILGASAAIFGLDAWRAWLTGAVIPQLGHLSSGGNQYGVWFYQMTTPYLAYGLPGWALFACAAIFLLTRRFDVFTAATAAFLISPYGFHYDMTVVCLGFGLLLFRRWQTLPPWQTFVCAMAFLVPLLVALGTWIASPLLLLGLYVQTENPIGTQGERRSSGENMKATTAG
ncbi:MAG: glycosyltransferase family 87 protein [Sphingomicrobium sp.]